MSKRIVSILVALALIAPAEPVTAASKSPKLAKCSGKQRRPANPYGSILPTVDPLAGTSTSTNWNEDRAGVHVFREPAASPAKPEDGKSSTQVPPISSASPPTSYRSC